MKPCNNNYKIKTGSDNDKIIIRSKALPQIIIPKGY